jgi:nucleotide-binding universal stress UspA family protein
MGEGKATFRKAALALNGGPTDELVVSFGCQLAKQTTAELVAIHVIEVDWSHELSDELTQENEAASAVLDQAEGIAERYRVKITGDLLQAREVAAALVDEAIEIGADAIILGLPYRKRFGGDFAIGATIPYVFQNAPCQVIVVREEIPVVAAKIESVVPAEKIAAPAGTTASASSAAGVGSVGRAKAAVGAGGWGIRNRVRGNGRSAK